MVLCYHDVSAIKYTLCYNNFQYDVELQPWTKINGKTAKFAGK